MRDHELAARSCSPAPSTHLTAREAPRAIARRADAGTSTWQHAPGISPRAPRARIRRLYFDYYEYKYLSRYFVPGALDAFGEAGAGTDGGFLTQTAVSCLLT